jgi:hypothetical protein
VDKGDENLQQAGIGLPSYRKLWESPIVESQSMYVVTANLLMIGDENKLDSISEWELLKIQTKASDVLGKSSLVLFVIKKDRNLRRERIVLPLNEALGRDAISDVYFLELSVGERMPRLPRNGAE